MSIPSTTQRLQLPLIAAGQAQKHVTHNEALLLLDAVVNLAVEDADRTVPPEGSSPGDRHIIANGAVGLWAGHVGEIALLEDGVWRFLQPQRGWRAWVAGSREFLVHDGAGWGRS